jgi:membrane protein
MEKKISKFRKRWDEAKSVWDESALRSQTELSKPHKFAHFCVLVWRSFTRNRCPVRASALAYASLLALIPMLAVVMSITSTFLKKEGEERIDEFIIKMVATLTPPGMLTTNVVAATTNVTVEATNLAPASAQRTEDRGQRTENREQKSEPANAVATDSSATNRVLVTSTTAGKTSTNVVPVFTQEEQMVKARKEIARSINQFIQNTRSGALGVTGSVLLIFVAISMLSRIEDTFNDIWGVARGRGWFTRIFVYWGVISLAPLLLVVALGLASGPHLESTRKLLTTSPFISRVVFQFLPVLVVCFTFALLYMLMPNTKVRWRAALVGGLVGGTLFHLNNVVSVLYVSRVVSNSRIYGSLGLVPVLMVGLYCSWLILLFGAQVAYAFQNRATYLEEKQVENINQRGREFVALRLMTCVGLRFERGDPPPNVIEISKELGVPTRLIQQVMHTLCAARLVVEVAGVEPAYVPARPLEMISCHDILWAMRASQGQELATRDEPTRVEVYGEFSRIQEAERQAAAAVTLLALVNRAQVHVKALGQ